MEFSIGDTVIYKNNESAVFGTLTEGKSYKIVNLEDGFAFVVDNYGNIQSFFATRFEKVENKFSELIDKFNNKYTSQVVSDVFVDCAALHIKFEDGEEFVYWVENNVPRAQMTRHRIVEVKEPYTEEIL
jgi:hypothetical protein